MADDPADEPPSKLEPGPKRDAVMGLFKQFDFDKTGLIPLEKLKSAKVSVGNAQSAVLTTMTAMDFNGDGQVEEAEWEQFFAMSGLSEDELDSIMKDLSEAASDMETIYNCTKLAGEADAAPTGDAEDAAEAAAALESMALADEQKALVEKLFAEWDFNSDGQIDLGKIAVKVEVGPREEKVFSELAKMDLNGDKVVTKEEMLTYFGVAATMFTESEFADMIKEMTDVATSENGVAFMLKLAEETKGTAAPEGDEDAADDSAPDLTPERTELIKSLFLSYTIDLDTPISLAALSDAAIDVGPAKEKGVLASMTIMDANGDGKVELQEMLDYFKAVGAALSDSELESIVENLKDAAAIEQAKAFAAAALG